MEWEERRKGGERRRKESVAWYGHCIALHHDIALRYIPTSGII